MAAITVYSAPEDGRKGRPKHVQHTCSFLINTILLELHLVGLLYIILYIYLFIFKNLRY